MISSIIVLFVITLIGGLAATKIDLKENSIRLPLIFAGSFLFAITIIHILPEIFTLSQSPMKLGVYILIGFFFQQFLEILTSGIEHGHFHHHHSNGKSIWFIIIGLSIHSLLEGSLLTHDSPFHEQHESYSLLIGILLHKAPAAFALVALLKGSKKFTIRILVLLIVFSAMSPLGLLLSGYLLNFSQETLLALFAFVSGAFLHISTTIFVESSPDHKFRASRMLVSAFGALVAIAAELFM